MTLYELVIRHLKNGESLFIRKLQGERPDDSEIHFIVECEEQNMKNSFLLTHDHIVDCPSAIQAILVPVIEATRKGIDINS